jgi:hypothetical protein
MGATWKQCSANVSTMRGDLFPLEPSPLGNDSGIVPFVSEFVILSRQPPIGTGHACPLLQDHA